MRPPVAWSAPGAGSAGVAMGVEVVEIGAVDLAAAGRRRAAALGATVLPDLSEVFHE